jgi:hypothetical protein
MKYKVKKVLYLYASYVLGVHYSAAGKCHLTITTTVNVGELNVVAVFLHEEIPCIHLIGSVSLSAIVDMAARRRISFCLGIELQLSCQQVACKEVVVDCIQKQKTNSMQ